MVEFSLVVGLFVFILYGLIACGMILATKQRITNAAAEGARAAVGAASGLTDTTAQQDAARAAAVARVAAAGLPVGHSATYTFADCATCITVTITYDLDGHPVVPPAPGLGLITPSTITSKAVVQYL